MKQQPIKLANDVSFPLDIVTQTIAILAKRRVGKSYTMRRLVEQLFRANLQVVIVDPKGDQWGIRSSADGKKPGFPVVILGGEHADAPLEANAGEVVANLVVKDRVSVLLDISLFRKHEVATFMTGFLENLYRLKAQEQYRTPLMLVIDEADAVAPQKPQRGEERMLGAAEDIVRRGGQRGIGCTLVTQRSAVLNKNVLTQAQMLIVLRTIAPQDLAAMNSWIDVHGEAEQRKILMESLPSLPIGDAWFWSPGWPTENGIFTRAHVFPIETFDSGATPKVGEKPIVPKNLADVDLDALKAQMAATIEKAKAENPAALRKRIAELEKHKCPVVNQNPVKVERIEIPAIGQRALKRLFESEGKMRKLIRDAKVVFAASEANVQRFEEGLDKLLAEIKKVSSPTGTVGQLVGIPVASRAKPTENSFKKPPTSSDSNPIEITGPEQRILNAIAWLESISVSQPVKEAVAFIAEYSPSSSGFTNACGSLRTKGLVTYPGGGTIAFTEEGRTHAVAPDHTLTTNELHRKVLEKLPGPERKLMQPILDAFPGDLSNEELAEKSGYSLLSSGFTNARGRLRTLGLIEYPQPGRVVAKKILFP